jgi:hypothetical protein
MAVAYRVQTAGGVNLTPRLGIVEAVRRCMYFRDAGIIGCRVQRDDKETQ